MNHGEGGSVTYRGKGEANEAREVSGAAVNRSHAGESCSRDGERVVEWGGGSGNRSYQLQLLRPCVG